MTKKGGDAPRPGGTAGALMPVLYRRPVILSADRFGLVRLGGGADFAFAVDVDCIPLLADEFSAACRTLPIVFSEDEVPLPTAVVGIDGCNNCIQGGARWSASRYMPDYIRRYPFILSHNAKDGPYSLCIDDAYLGLGKGDGEPLFVGGQPSTFTMMALDYCRQYQARHQNTLEFVDILKSLDLLVSSTAIIRLPGGEERKVGGFRAIDRERWANIGEAALLRLFQTGWLEAVFAHFISQANWPSIASPLGGEGG